MAGKPLQSSGYLPPRLSAEEEAVSPGREGAQVGQSQVVMALWDTSRVEATPKLTPPLQPPQHQLAWLGAGGPLRSA